MAHFSSTNRKETERIDKYFKNKHGKFVKNKKSNLNKVKRQILQQELIEYKLDCSPLNKLKTRSISNQYKKKSQQKTSNIICSHHMLDNKITNRKNMLHSMSHKNMLGHLVYGYMRIQKYVPVGVTKLCYEYLGYDESLVNIIFPNCHQLPFKIHYFTVQYSKIQTVMEGNIILTIYPNLSCISCLKPLTIKFIKYSKKIKSKFDYRISEILLNHVIVKVNGAIKYKNHYYVTNTTLTQKTENRSNSRFYSASPAPVHDDYKGCVISWNLKTILMRAKLFTFVASIIVNEIISFVGYDTIYQRSIAGYINVENAIASPYKRSFKRNEKCVCTRPVFFSIQSTAKKLSTNSLKESCFKIKIQKCRFPRGRY